MSFYGKFEYQSKAIKKTGITYEQTKRKNTMKQTKMKIKTKICCALETPKYYFTFKCCLCQPPCSDQRKYFWEDSLGLWENLFTASRSDKKRSKILREDFASKAGFTSDILHYKTKILLVSHPNSRRTTQQQHFCKFMYLFSFLVPFTKYNN